MFLLAGRTVLASGLAVASAHTTEVAVTLEGRTANLGRELVSFGLPPAARVSLGSTACESSRRRRTGNQRGRSRVGAMAHWWQNRNHSLSAYPVHV